MSAALDHDLAWISAAPLDEFLSLMGELTAEEASDALWYRCRSDLGLFFLSFFGERLTHPFNEFHRDVMARPKAPWQTRTREQRRADAAPRGNAKSTFDTFINLIHDAVYGYELFAGVLSTTFDLSQDLVKDLHKVFTEADLYGEFHAAYGPFQVVGSATDFVVHVPGQDPRGCRFKAFSFGGTVRGVKHAGIRPTKWVIDDGEHPEKVRSPEQRQKTWDFLTKDVLKSGDKFTIYRVVGTVLHPDSMLNRIIGYASGEYGLGWQGKRWQSVISWPDNREMWQQCRELWADLTDPDRMDTARRFYQRNKAEMDKGAAVLWEQKEDLLDLHIMLWTDGAASFNSEKQNIATDPERQVFYPERFRRCTFDGVSITTSKGRRINIRDCAVAGWLDPRASEQREKNDYAATAVVARERRTGYRFVLHCDPRRDNTTQQLQRVWGLYDIFGPSAQYGFEDNGFATEMGKSFEHMRRERDIKGLSVGCNLTGHTSSENKHNRISRLAPDIDNGFIEFDTSISKLVTEQFRQIPTGTHDDAPDAIERADWLVCGGGTARATTRGAPPR